MTTENTTAVAVNRTNYLDRTDKIDWLKTIIGKNKPLFGCSSFEEAAVLAITMDTENITPMEYMNTYDTVQGRPRMKSDAMLAKFVSRGGDYNIKKREADECTIEFIWRDKTTSFTYTMEDAKTAGLVKGGGAYEKHPKNMLFLRCASNGLRMYAPELFAGHYTKEEILSSAEPAPPVQVQPLFGNNEKPEIEDKSAVTEYEVEVLPPEGKEVSRTKSTPIAPEVKDAKPEEADSAEVVEPEKAKEETNTKPDSPDFGWANCLVVHGVDLRQALDWMVGHEWISPEACVDLKPKSRPVTVAKIINLLSDEKKASIEDRIDNFKRAVEDLHKEMTKEGTK